MKRFSEFIVERVAVSSFTFGFELEAIYNPNGDVVDADKHTIADLDPDEVIAKIKKLEPVLGLKGKFGGTYTRDGSIHPAHESHVPFEYVSGVMQFTSQNIAQLKKSLKSIQGLGVYTNETCGFHIHFSFPTVQRKQLLWIKTAYLFDSIAQSSFEYFQSSNGPIQFWSKKYASVGDKKSIVTNLSKIIEQHKSGDDSNAFVHSVNKFFEQDYYTSKYNVLGIHEKYRTLEWRGPRGFLNTGDTDDIIHFVEKLKEFVQWLSEAENTKRIIIDAKNGVYIDREDFYAMIDHHTETRIKTFGIDVAEKIDAARTNKQRADIAFDFFKTMDISGRAATNYRKIANRIHTRYPAAWDLFMKRVNSERSIPDHIVVFLNKVARHFGVAT